MEMHTATAAQCSKTTGLTNTPTKYSRSLEIIQALIRLFLWNNDEVICKHGWNKQEQTSLSAVMVFPA